MFGVIRYRCQTVGLVARARTEEKAQVGVAGRVGGEAHFLAEIVKLGLAFDKMARVHVSHVLI